MKKSTQLLARRLNILLNDSIKSRNFFNPNPEIEHLIKKGKSKIVFTRINDVFMDNPLIHDKEYRAISEVKELFRQQTADHLKWTGKIGSANTDEYTQAIENYEIRMNERNMASNNPETFFTVLNDNEIGYFQSYLIYISKMIERYVNPTPENLRGINAINREHWLKRIHNWYYNRLIKTIMPERWEKRDRLMPPWKNIL